VDISKAHNAVNRIVRTIVGGVHSVSKSGCRAGTRWRDAKVDRGKKPRSVSRAANEVFEMVLFLFVFIVY
jgi:hypothetical protein